MTDASSILVIHEGKLHTFTRGERTHSRIVSAIRTHTYAESIAERRKAREEAAQAEADAKEKAKKKAAKKAKKAAQRVADDACEPVFVSFDIETGGIEDDGFISIIATPQAEPLLTKADFPAIHWFESLHIPQGPSEPFTSVNDMPVQRYASGGFVSSSTPSRRPIPDPVPVPLDPKRPIKIAPNVVIAADALCRLVDRSGYAKTAQALGVGLTELRVAHMCAEVKEA